MAKSSPIHITLKPAVELTATEIADCYALVARTGFPFKTGYLESAHLVHNPTMVFAYQNGRLIGVQSYSLYQIQTPFSRQSMPFFYGGIAFQDADAAGRGIAFQMSTSYIRYALGPVWPIRSYAFLLRTPNPKLMHILSRQHQLFLPTDSTLTPTLTEFVREFVRKERSIQYPIDDRLVVTPPDAERVQTDITDQWPLLYRASSEPFNKLAFDLNLIAEIDGHYHLMGNFLLVLGRSSRSQLLKSIWSTGRWWLRKQFLT
jgi:hypothetical protein